MTVRGSGKELLSVNLKSPTPSSDANTSCVAAINCTAPLCLVFVSFAVGSIVPSMTYPAFLTVPASSVVCMSETELLAPAPKTLI